MLVLALVGLLAAPAPEALTRVPGMRLRLGMAESAVLDLGSFPEIKAPDAGTMTTRQGPARFFGVPGEATCYLKDGRLARVRFVATGVSRHSQDYVDGQLRRMLLDRRCERDDPGDRVCDWLGPRVRVTTEMKKGGLVARADPWPPPTLGTDTLRAAIAAPERRTKNPERSATVTTPPAPRSSPPRREASGATDPVAAPPAVITLPETLTISLASRNSADVWPQIVSSPQLHYPEAARSESIQGIVWVLALVDPAGRVLDAWVERSVPELDTSALAWVSRSRFAPCERKGKPCRFHVRIAVLFTLY